MNEPARFCKRPVEIEAMQLVGGNTHAVASWMTQNGGTFRALTHAFDATLDTLLIDTLEGEMAARNTDWIIKGVAGEFYPCRNDIFEATYEQVREES